jgi:hypothetical protein
MKTKIFGLVAIVCIAFAASFIANKVSKSSYALSMVAAANVEALASHEMTQKENRDSTKVAKFGYKNGEWVCYLTPGNAC